MAAPALGRRPEADGPADASPPPREGLGYRPGLDGLRGLAVAAVLVYHGGFDWAKGGYLGVSTFFTLSGFLITTLALDERLATGTMSLRGFWRRRFRRLLPASLAAIALAVVMAVAVGDTVQRENLTGDIVGALAYVANWRFLLSDQSYAELFAEPSPLLHFWSLAIEEQFYLVFPLLLGGLWWRGPARFRRLRHADRRDHDVRGAAALFGVLAAGSLALTLFGGLDDQDIYLNTATRSFEVLAGCLLAVAVHAATRRRWLDGRGRSQRLLAAGGVVTLLAAVASWNMIALTDTRLYQGGLALYALASTVTVLAAALVTGPLAVGLGARPLVHLGQISYGVYLYHWPIFLWLRQGTDLGPWPRFAIGVVLSLGLAEVSARFLERPIRTGSGLGRLRPWMAAPPVMALLIVGAAWTGATAPPPTIDLEAATEALNEPREPPPPPTTAAPEAPQAPPSARVAFFGDSTGLMTGYGFSDWLAGTGRGISVPGGANLGCSLMGPDELRLGERISSPPGGCPDWPVTWAEAVAASQPSTVVVQLGAWDVQDRRIGDDPDWRAPGHPEFDAVFGRRLLEAVDVFTAGGAQVVWLLAPVPTAGREGRLPDPAYDAVAPRMLRINELISELPDIRPDDVRVVDLAGWFEASGEQDRLRPDGMHFSRETAFEVTERFLGEAVLGPDWWNRPTEVPSTRTGR